MFTPLTYKQVAASHPEAIKDFEEQKKKSRSKSKNISLSEFFKFRYETAERLEGMSLGDMLSNLGKVQKELTVEETVAKRVKNSSTYLVASYNHLRLTFKLETVPTLVVEGYRKSTQDIEDGRKRYAALPQAQKDKELEDNLKELRKHSGFMEFGVGPR